MTSPTQTQREAFEKYMSEDGKWPRAIIKDQNGEYLFSVAASNWRVWQDALATSAPQSPAPAVGHALAMRVLQSDLYQKLDDVERAECDALVKNAAAGAALPDGLGESFSNPYGTVENLWKQLKRTEDLLDAALSAKMNLPSTPPSKAEGLPEGLRERIAKIVFNGTTDGIGFDEIPEGFRAQSYRVTDRILAALVTPPAVPEVKNEIT